MSHPWPTIDKSHERAEGGLPESLSNLAQRSPELVLRTICGSEGSDFTLDLEQWRRRHWMQARKSTPRRQSQLVGSTAKRSLNDLVGGTVVILLSAAPGGSVLGTRGQRILRRFMGLILAAVGAEILLAGVHTFVPARREFAMQ